jgi:hypothetical protein
MNKKAIYIVAGVTGLGLLGWYFYSRNKRTIQNNNTTSNNTTSNNTQPNTNNTNNNQNNKDNKGNVTNNCLPIFCLVPPCPCIPF